MYVKLLLIGMVAPFTGAWIEIDGDGEPDPTDIVAPFTGAWIEIDCQCPYPRRLPRRSLHGSVD